MEAEAVGRPDALESFRRWAAGAVAIAALVYLGYAMWRGLAETGKEIGGFQWSLYVPILLLTLVNYGLRYLKWHYLLGRLGVDIPHRANVWVFASGLAMVISPAKAGEVVKPYLVRVITGAPMARTIPALIAERVTDGIAVVALAALGISTFAPDRWDVILGTVGIIAAGFVVLLSKPLSLWILDQLKRIPMIGRVGAKLEEAYLATRQCLSPVPLTVTVIASFIAWFAECVGLWLVFRGLSVETTLEASTFLYAFSTTIGGASPGGLGVTDVALGELALGVIPGLGDGQAVAASLLIRVATLWFGVILGAVALLRIESVIRTFRSQAAPQ